jgi:RNA-directed DNA polymerase
MVAKDSAIMGYQPPAKRKGPPRSEILAEQGKPIVLPETVGEPKGTLLALWVEECGKSECLPVTGRIRAETWPDAKAGGLPRGHLWRENLINRCTQESR